MSDSTTRPAAATDAAAGAGEKVLMDGAAASRVLPYLPLPGLSAPQAPKDFKTPQASQIIQNPKPVEKH